MLVDADMAQEESSTNGAVATAAVEQMLLGVDIIDTTSISPPLDVQGEPDTMLAVDLLVDQRSVEATDLTINASQEIALPPHRQPYLEERPPETMWTHVTKPVAEPFSQLTRQCRFPRRKKGQKDQRPNPLEDLEVKPSPTTLGRRHCTSLTVTAHREIAWWPCS